MSEQPFWKTTEMSDMTLTQWESLCDNCGRCCLHKLEDEETGELAFTNVVCRLYDMKSCQCSDYKNRRKEVEGCLKLSPDFIPVDWLPETCSYRLLEEGKDLPEWHPLVSGKKASLAAAGMSLKGKILPEDFVEDEDLEDHIIAWVR